VLVVVEIVVLDITEPVVEDEGRVIWLELEADMEGVEFAIDWLVVGVKVWPLRKLFTLINVRPAAADAIITPRRSRASEADLSKSD
jgi:hypothetical protein